MCKTTLRLPLAACRCNGQPCETMCQKPGHKNDKSTNATLRCVSLCALDCPESPHNGYIAQWLERLTADQQVPGSNPGVPSLGARFLFGFRALFVRLAYAAASACLKASKRTSNVCWFLALASCLRFVCSSFASLVFPLAVLFRRFGLTGDTSKPKLLNSRAGRSASRLASENVCHFLRLRGFHRTSPIMRAADSKMFCRYASDPHKHASCGVRTHAQLPAVDLKSTPLTTRAN